MEKKNIELSSKYCIQRMNWLHEEIISMMQLAGRSQLCKFIPEVVTSEHNSNNVLANVMNITLHSSQNYRTVVTTLWV